MRLWRIYRLIDPTMQAIDAIRYVGITSTSLATRLSYHLRGNDGNTEKWAWITDLGKRGLRPSIEQIDTLYGRRAQAERCERVWQYRYLAAGADLLNVIPGDREMVRAFLQRQELLPPTWGHVNGKPFTLSLPDGKPVEIPESWRLRR